MKTQIPSIVLAFLQASLIAASTELDTNWREGLFRAYGADDAAKKEGLQRSIETKYREGGEQFYELRSGLLFRSFPRKQDFKDRRDPDAPISVEEYTVFFAIHHTPDIMARLRDALPAIKNHKSFKNIAKLFEADTDEKRSILASSIARVWALGGEYNVRTKQRELPEAVLDISGFMEVLAKRSETELKSVREASRAIDDAASRDPNLLEKLIELESIKFGQTPKKK